MLVIYNAKLALRTCGLEEDKKGKKFLAIKGVIVNENKKKLSQRNTFLCDR